LPEVRKNENKKSPPKGAENLFERVNEKSFVEYVRLKRPHPVAYVLRMGEVIPDQIFDYVEAGVVVVVKLRVGIEYLRMGFEYLRVRIEYPRVIILRFFNRKDLNIKGLKQFENLIFVRHGASP